MSALHNYHAVKKWTNAYQDSKVWHPVNHALGSKTSIIQVKEEWLDQCITQGSNSTWTTTSKAIMDIRVIL